MLNSRAGSTLGMGERGRAGHCQGVRGCLTPSTQSGNKRGVTTQCTQHHVGFTNFYTYIDPSNFKKCNLKLHTCSWCIVRNICTHVHRICDILVFISDKNCMFHREILLGVLFIYLVFSNFMFN